MPELSLDLSQPRTVRGVIVAALRCYASHPGLFAVLGAIVVVPWGAAIWLIDGESLLTEGHLHGTHGLIELALNTLIVGPLISALHVNAVSDLGAGRRPRLRSVLPRGLRVLPVVAAADVASGLATVAGLFCLIVPGVILWARWATVSQAAAMEDVGWLDALHLSWQRTRGSVLHVLGVVIAVVVPLVAIDRGIGALLAPGAHFGSILIAIAIQTVLLSYQALTAAFLYHDVLSRYGAIPAAPLNG